MLVDEGLVVVGVVEPHQAVLVRCVETEGFGVEASGYCHVVDGDAAVGVVVGEHVGSFRDGVRRVRSIMCLWA